MYPVCFKWKITLKELTCLDCNSVSKQCVDSVCQLIYSLLVENMKWCGVFLGDVTYDVMGTLSSYSLANLSQELIAILKFREGCDMCTFSNCFPCKLKECEP